MSISCRWLPGSALVVIVVALLSSAVTAAAQPPIPLPIPAPAGGQRAPDDKIEGVIFEYRGTLRPSSKPADDDSKEIEGKFRLEKSAIFDVSPTIKLPSKAETDKVAQKVLSGKGGDVKLPQAPQQKRLGQYTKIGSGKLRLDFDDKESLLGTMVINRKKETDDVWIGTYTERKDGRAGRVWVVTLRPIED